MQLEIKHKYKFSREVLFDAFGELKTFQEFMFRTPAGKLLEAKIDFEAGGEFVITEAREKMTAEHRGTFVEIDHPQKISFVFAAERGVEPAYVELFFNSIPGGSELVLSQELDEKWSPYLDKIKHGWSTILESFDRVMTTQDQPSADAAPKDSQGQILAEGDSVKVIKDLNVKGSSMVVKRGSIVKKIHLVAGNDTEVDCKVDGVALALETRWLVKV